MYPRNFLVILMNGGWKSINIWAFFCLIHLPRNLKAWNSSYSWVIWLKFSCNACLFLAENRIIKAWHIYRFKPCTLNTFTMCGLWSILFSLGLINEFDSLALKEKKSGLRINQMSLILFSLLLIGWLIYAN